MDPTALAPGTTIGSYVIERLVAVGGSAAVYQARDPRACRTVAIKLLLADPGSDPEGGRRLLHEARAYTRLVHPRIVTLYEVGEHQGRVFLVMEWVEGTTLAERLAAGALGEREAAEIMLQVADGLSAAHALGLAHRDLKPANIMLTPERGAMLLDLGLVKSVDPETLLPRSLVTVDGAIIGTPAYMSPEQVRGQELSLASDVFSYGSVLYEVLAGSPAFARQSVFETLEAVASGRYQLQPLSRTRLGRGLRLLLQHCLCQDPADRPGDARELVVELQRLLQGRRSRSPLASRTMVATVLLTAVVTACCCLLLWAALGRRQPPPVALGGVTVLPVEGQLPVITPDGGAVVYCLADGRDLWLSPLGTGTPQLVWAGREHIGNVGLTPDGRWVLFTAAEPQGPWWVWEVPISGGLPRKVTRGSAVAVSPDGLTIAAIEEAESCHQLVVCLRDGTERRRLLRFRDSMIPKSCCFTGDGARILVSTTDGVRWSQLTSVAVSDGSARTIIKLRGIAWFGLTMRPHTDCALWCLRTSQAAPSMLFATALDSGVTRGVYPGPGLASYPSFSADGGKLILQVEENERELVEVMVDPELGKATESFTVLPGSRNGGQPRVSPDAKRIAFQSARGDLWVLERATGSVGPLLTTGEASFNPAWSPDGSMIAYSCIKNNRSALWMAGADGSDPRRLTDGEDNCFQPVWHPGGRCLLLISDRHGSEELYLLSIDRGEMVRLSHDGAINPAVSPDGSLVAITVPYTSQGPVLRLVRLSGDLDTTELVWQRPVVINRWAGGKARFSPDGRWLALDQPSGALGADVWALPVAGGGSAEMVRLTAFPSPASLVGWLDWSGKNRLVVTRSKSPIRLLLLEDAQAWLPNF